MDWGWPMNTKFISYNFEEIQEEVDLVLKKMNNGMTEEEFYKAAQHIYHHLNIAWNSRDTQPHIVFDLDDPRMQDWMKFPTDIRLL